METRLRPTTRTILKRPSIPRLRWHVSERCKRCAVHGWNGDWHRQNLSQLSSRFHREIPTLATMNKCLAPSSEYLPRTNRSGTRAEATNKREISQSSLVGNGGC